MKFKKKHTTFLVLILFAITSNAQVSINADGDFMNNGQKFYPKCINYSVQILIDPNNLSNLYFSPDHGLGATNGCEAFNGTTFDQNLAIDLLKDDFNQIASMGFNTIRICGLPGHDYNSTSNVFGKRILHFNGNDTLSFYKPFEPNDPQSDLMNTYYNAYDIILNAANTTTNNGQPAPLKIIFLTLNYEAGQVNNTNYNQWIADFLTKLSTKISNSPNRNAFLAFDLINEPTYNIDVKLLTKLQACNLMSTWFSTIKAVDNTLLVTSGSSGWIDVFSFDPSILPYDFSSLHYYPGFKKHFDHPIIPAMQQIMRKRSVNDLYWMKNNVNIPWIVGETGFSASTESNYTLIHPTLQVPNWQAWGLDGVLSDQADYARNAQENVLNCGSKGFSWWDYQEKAYYGVSLEKDDNKQNFFGLLQLFTSVNPPSEKPVVQEIRNFTTTTPYGTCPVDYSDTYDANKLYYNPMHFPSSSNSKTGFVKDQQGNPIKDAVIFFSYKVRNKITAPGNPRKIIVTEVHPSDVTFSDKNGFFTCIPMDYIQPLTEGNITSIKIGAAGTNIFYSDVPTSFPANGSTYTLNSIGFNLDKTITGDFSTNGSFNGDINNPQVIVNERANNKLTLNNVNVWHYMPGMPINADFTARTEIDITGTFDSNINNQVDIHLVPPNIECNDLSAIAARKKTSIINENYSNESLLKNEFNNINLQFKNRNISFVVKPNPNNGLFTIENQDGYENYSITVTDLLGNQLYSTTNNSQLTELNLTHISKGVYNLSIYTNTHKQFQKLIIQ
jgi:hypothetical protein